MDLGPQGGSQINNSFNEFRFLNLRHRAVAPLELRTSERVAISKGGRARGWETSGRGILASRRI